ncbi:MAG: transcription-repair coupling factor [Treponemataceae bacterium]
MNTLSLQTLIQNWKELKQGVEIADFPSQIEGVAGSFVSFFALVYQNHIMTRLDQKIRYFQQYPKQSELDLVFIVPSEKDATELEVDLNTVFNNNENSGIEILNLCWWGMVPYRPVGKGSSIFGKRSAFLSKLAEKSRKEKFSGNKLHNYRIYIITQRSFLTPVPSPDYLNSFIFSIKKGDNFDTVLIAEKLIALGYSRVPRVSVPGEFTLRGEVLDIYMSGEENAYRIVFDFDTIEKIRSFNVETQMTLNEHEKILIYPMKEVLWNDKLIEELERKILDRADLASFDFSPYISELKTGYETEGEELLYPLLFNNTTILDYLDEDTTLIYCDFDRQKNAQENFDREYLGLYRKERFAMENENARPVLPPQDMLFNFEKLVQKHEKSIILRTIHDFSENEKHPCVFEVEPACSFFGNINYLKETITDLLADEYKIFIFAESENQSLRISEILKDFSEEKNLNILPQSISSGFRIPCEKILVIQENEIFGRRKHIPKSVKHAKTAVIDTFVELNPEDYVVHVNYGIGQFKGIDRVKAMGNERDYIKLEYADEEVVFIPIEQVNLVQRYIGNEGDAPRLDHLGSKAWENRKNRVKKSVEDLAKKLISLYSRRKAERGFAFPKDNEMQMAFEAAFPYTETPDQITVNEEIKTDMEKPLPMDRLICGDVGYGKTELAMRAAFKAVLGGKQVAFLAPTTILAEQHFESCKERFEKFPVAIAHMSRFVAKSEQKKILENLADGKIDILIGTHRIIQKDVTFKNLGLMIIDEEQRFGVKDKERLKEMKANIDCLAMSATPIPRTLHMSLLKIRDMSLLTTAPQNRQPIETVIDEYNDERVSQAIRREVERGGQVFYLHNRVENLDKIRMHLERLMPEMTVDTAHGQMNVNELDDIFRRFKMGGSHILVATTIIENGIDIPNVNTIIIDRADMYGISQLYQLRGRVGRRDRKAYAYLLYPENHCLSDIAMKRLQVISDFTELGSGFKIAMKDMEIRGAGNLLGKDQSGDVYSVGFDMYIHLLEEAVQRLTDENYRCSTEVLLELEYTGFIPDTYIKNLQTKMEIYKKIAAISTKEEYENVYLELEDRFGPIPDEVFSLLSLAQIKVICRELNISALKEHMGSVKIEFDKVSEISVEKVLRLIKESNGKVKLNPDSPNMLILQIGKIGLKEKSEFIREKLASLQ